MDCRIFIGLLLAALALVWPGARGAYARPADTLVIGLQLEPPTLDPTSGAAAPIKDVVFPTLFEGLVRLGPGGSVRPWLATGWTVSADQLTYSFRLRPGVRFQDGAPFDAAAVKFSLDRARAATSTNSQKTRFQVIASIETPDPMTVVIRLKRRSSTFLQVLGWGDAVILSPRSAAHDITHPIGTGPFRFVDWRRGEAVTLERNPDYWGAGPHVQRLVFRFLADPTAALAALRAGDVDAFPGFPAPEAIAELRRDPRFTVRIGPSEGETLVAINERVKPLADVRVRRALSYAIDRRAVIQAAMFGYGQPIGSHYPPQDLGYVDLTGLYPHDPARARALLAEAGYPHGLTLTLKLPPPTYARRSGEVIAAQLAQAGVRVRIADVEWAQWLSDVFGRHDYDLTIVSHVEPLDYAIYGRDDYYFGYSSPVAKALLAEIEGAPDPAVRMQALQDLQRQIATDAVNVFLFEAPAIGVWTSRLTDIWAPTPVTLFDYASARFTAPAGRDEEAAVGGGRIAEGLMVALLLAAVIAAAWRAGPAYLAGRALALAATLLAASVIVFLLVQVAPGDPARAMMGLNADPASLHAVRLELGLEGPAWRRYLAWMAGLARGDFGISYTYRVPVGPLIAERLAVSAPLTLYAATLSTLAALGIGLVSAARPGGWVRPECWPAERPWARHPELLGRHGADPALRRGPAPCACGRLSRLVGRRGAGARRADPAGPGAGGAPGGGAGPGAAGRADRGGRGGVRAGRPRKGPQPKRGASAPRPAERPGAGADGAGAAGVVPAGRRRGGGDAVRLAGPGAAGVPGGDPARPDCGAGRGDGAGRSGGGRELPRRPRRRRRRSPPGGAARMSQAAPDLRPSPSPGATRRNGEAGLVAGAILVGGMAAVALLSLVWTPYPPDAIDVAARLSPPSVAHLFGTDDYGRDVASQVMAGARTALLVALASCGVGLGIGCSLGLYAAARRGWADELVMRGSDLVFAFPALLSAVLLAAALGPGVLDAVIAIGVYSAPVFARVTRTGALRLWSLDFVLASRAAGKSPLRISLEHVLPNLWPALLVQATLQLSLAVVAEAGLAYIGLSAQPPQPSWGRMLADAQTLIGAAPWLAILPGLAIVATVAGFGLLGEGLRRRLSPP